MVELYQDTLIDLLLPKNAKRLKLDIKKDSKVIFSEYYRGCININSSFFFLTFSLCFMLNIVYVSVFNFDFHFNGLILCLSILYSQGMVVVENVTILSISSYDELKSIIERGSEQRHTTGTLMNEQSSRSHLILSVVIESTNLQTQSVARGKV